VAVTTDAAADRALPAMEAVEEEAPAATTRSTRTRPAAITASASAKTHMPAARRGATTGARAATAVTAAGAIRMRDATVLDETAATATTTVAPDRTGETDETVATVMAEAMVTTAGGVDGMEEALAAVVEALASPRRSRLYPTRRANPRRTSLPSPTSSSASAV
jgi:hypothetical protein